MTFKKWVGYILPHNAVRWIAQKFTHDNVYLLIGSTKVKVHVWMTGKEEGFFVSDVSSLEGRRDALKARLEELEEEIAEKRKEVRQ